MATDTPRPEEFEQIYREQLQGNFYADDYYRERNEERESAIVYSDDEDKQLFAYIINTFFRCRRVLEVGCAMGYLLKELIAYGYDAYGIDFSQYCVEQAPEIIRDRVKQADLLSLPFPDSSFDMVIGLDILEHLPPSLLHRALQSIRRVLKSSGVYLGVIPAYGDNKYGPMVFDYQQKESWIEDAQACRPFREIPLDVNGKPHMGHLIHATVDWWEKQFKRAGFERLGQVELAIHRIYDTYLDQGRWGIFIFHKKSNSILDWFINPHALVVKEFMQHYPLRPQGFYRWEYWPNEGWTRWTEIVATEIIRRKGRFIIIPFLVNHPDCSEAAPVFVQFSFNNAPVISFNITSRGWRTVRLNWHKKEKIGILRINVSRTFSPATDNNTKDRRQLGIALRPIIQKFM